MPKACRTSYHFALKLKVIAEAEAVENSSEIARDYRILMVRHWKKDQGLKVEKIIQNVRDLDGLEDHAIVYDNEMPEVADNDMGGRV